MASRAASVAAGRRSRWGLGLLPTGSLWGVGLPLAGKLRELVRARGGEPAVVLGLAAVALIGHGLNMFQYPAFTGFDDEGIYAAQAWAVLREGQLSPYTYVYDHVPGGWILLAAWMGLTGGPHAFGGAIDSGRALMLLLHVASVLLLYRVARKLGCGVALAAAVGVLFSVSPLALIYQRRLLLDNIMLTWCLLSLDLLLDGWGRLSRVSLSGICFGIALLTKETAIFLLPAMLYIAWQQRWEHQGRFAVFGWLVPMGVVVSWYPLFAALKGELLPAGGSAQFGISGYGNTGVSLIDSLVWQMGRDGGGPFNLNNEFWTLVRTDWLGKDALLLVGGSAATLINAVRGIGRHTVGGRRVTATALLGLLPLLYLVRGGIVFDFYILFAIPFFCLNLGVLLAPIARRLPARAAVLATCSAMVAIVAGYAWTGEAQPLYRQQPAEAGREALTWIKANVPADAFIITRDDLWVDLREAGLGGPAFPNVQSYTKVASDPAIRTDVFGDDWHGVDYLVVSPGLQQTLVDSDNTIALDALQHAHPVKTWTADGSALELWKVDKVGATEASLLQGSAAYITSAFDVGGAFTARDGSVTSEAQAYGMLRAVWSDDRDGFDQTWHWTASHLLNAEGLLAWRWQQGQLDPHSASDADTDAALALLLAGQHWGNSAWTDAGTQMVRNIWQHDVAHVDQTAYMTAGDWAPALDVVAINPSYFAPYAYHVFAEVDPADGWQLVIDSGYQVLFDASASPLGADHSAGLPPDWVGLDRSNGSLVPLALDGSNPSDYGYDAPRTYWRVALDLRWDHDGRAAAYLQQAGFLRDEVDRAGSVRSVYGHDGSVAQDATSAVSTSGALAALLTLDPASAHRLYAGQMLGQATTASGLVHWGAPDDLYAQEWGWFGTALYADAVPDLWQVETTQ